ncbi:MAG: ABC transporter ATP-binding protein [Clostridiales bacterium]|nr:ABC transporter ATP-binding protein [Clostridiales bacterium]
MPKNKSEEGSRGGLRTLLIFITKAKKYRKYIFFAAAAMVLSSLLSLFTPYIVQQLISKLTDAENVVINELVKLGIILIAAYLGRAVCRFITLSQSHVAAWNFVGELTLECYDKLQSLSMRYYSDKQTGQLMSTMLNDSRQLELLIAHALPDLCSNVIIIIAVAISLIIINPTLMLLTMIPVPFIIFVSSLFSTRVAPLFQINQKVYAELNGLTQEKLSGMKEIQANSKEEYEHSRMKDFCKHYSFVNIRANYAGALFHPSVELLTSIGTVIVLVAGGFFVTNGRMNVAEIVGFFMYLSLFYTPLAALSRLNEDVQNALASGERVLDLLETEPDIVDSLDAVEMPAGAEPEIKFDDVTFSYNDGIKVLQNVSFTAKAGEMTAVVGVTGAGKTTLVSLLERFYQPEGGRILYGGVDINEYKVKSLRSKLSMVMQDIFLFNGSVAENIAYGVDDATSEQIKAAAVIACADGFISRMPEGYETQIGERGVKLSGGQKQRIAIARAVLRKTPVIILDEATSAVDTETEAEIQRAIENLRSGDTKPTLIVIAHRLSTVRRASSIIVLEDGKIAESGNHESLVRAGGIYAKLCGVQDGLLDIAQT